MGYVKIKDTDHGELGHNGWTWVLNHPVASGEVGPNGYPAYYEETGHLFVTGQQYSVEFKKTFGASRSGMLREIEINIDVSPEEAETGMANRDAYDAVHMPAGGYKFIVD